MRPSNLLFHIFRATFFLHFHSMNKMESLFKCIIKSEETNNKKQQLERKLLPFHLAFRIMCLQEMSVNSFQPLTSVYTTNNNIFVLIFPNKKLPSVWFFTPDFPNLIYFRVLKEFRLVWNLWGRKLVQHVFLLIKHFKL